eukprot:TRINITY_DN59127_c0_g1_i1.p2 TRINITY_DN59127_c0_g1~~TRINITY_DN59127_c0_g1_i1.p2  ORF type:complete len:296 (-),score=64.69 TRINITY_DN59127_c0_g1_i1:2648-3511(-)
MTDRTPEEIAEAARQLQEAARIKRAQDEYEQEYLSEKKRREDGKKYMEAQRRINLQKEETERKQMQESRKKEKQEDEAYKAKLRAQMAAERAAKLQERQERQSPEDAIQQQQRQQQELAQKFDGDQTTIRIRLLTGETITRRFNVYEKLEEVILALQELPGHSPYDYSLLSQYPTHRFSLEEQQNTFKELSLCPSASLICSPAPKPEAKQEGLLARLFALLWAFITLKWFFSTPREQQFAEFEPTPVAQQPPAWGSNVKRLDGSNKPSAWKKDTENYYNGNSTQFEG